MTLTLEDHRAMYRDELDFSPSQRTPPVAYTYDQTERTLVPDDRPLVYSNAVGVLVQVPDSPTQSTEVGMPMSSEMYRYLAGPSSGTPWAVALKALRFWCRRNHRYHQSHPAWRGSLCWQLVALTVIANFSPYNAGKILRYDHPEPVLRDALRFIEDEMDRARAKAERRAREDEGHGPGAIAAPERRHHAVPGLHEKECPQCRAA